MDADAAGRLGASSLIAISTCDQLLAQDANSGGCFDSQTHLIALYLNYRNRNIRPYQDLLRQLSTQNEHLYLLAISKRVPITPNFLFVLMPIVS
jgi:hypothetical protein